MTAARTSGLKATRVPMRLSQGDNGDERHPPIPRSVADDEELNHYNNSSSIMVGTTSTLLTSVFSSIRAQGEVKITTTLVVPE